MGMSYGMMIAVQLDHQTELDRLWTWVQKHMANGTGEISWSCSTGGNKNSQGGAPDGEAYFATALIFARNRWGDSTGPVKIAYGTEAQWVLNVIRTKSFNSEYHLVKFVSNSNNVDPSYVLPAFYCGDGTLGPDEICDDGLSLRSSGNGCSADCQSIEPGWYCPFVGQRCMRIGGQPGGSSTCEVGDCQPRCGNGVVESEEACDRGVDRNDGSYGGCDYNRRLVPRCGDGVVNGDEGCDLGAGNGIAQGDSGVQCSRICKVPRPSVCGDGTVDPEQGEACDLGDRNGGLEMPCSTDCQIVSVSCLGMCL